ncbi:hypothetical protein GQ43DRAFT_46580 [Delitschia confertaspora ATCC 74209]|uniref:Uncharacterized protein n=1 Tax=Delitschia confertaspora ATCC 74209 TaxID=1513339 RepID=A0A9P4JL69_9PLEO|nr:hypothetical protein GQ43DRAFT_46580 [Delitschia confertaspora ATCC 74209]
MTALKSQMYICFKREPKAIYLVLYFCFTGISTQSPWRRTCPRGNREDTRKKKASIEARSEIRRRANVLKPKQCSNAKAVLSPHTPYLLRPYSFTLTQFDMQFSRGLGTYPDILATTLLACF